MYDRVERHFAVLRAAVDDAGGEVFATMGDGIAAAFTSAEAARAGRRRGAAADAAIGLAVRMGIHTGEVERVGDDFRGRPVNRAARIMAVGHGGQILVSDVSAALVRTGPEPGRARRPRHPPAARPRRAGAALAGGRTPTSASGSRRCAGVDTFSNNLPAQRSSLVGRDLDVAAGDRPASQQHRIVTLTGVGGVGKTRLAVQAAADLLARFANVWFVELASVDRPRRRRRRDRPDDRRGGGHRSAGRGRGRCWPASDTLLVVDNCEHVVDSAAA